MPTGEPLSTNKRGNQLLLQPHGQFGIVVEIIAQSLEKKMID